MRWQGLAAACAMGLLAATVSATEQDNLPAPWFRSGVVMPETACHTVVELARGGPGFDRNLVIRCDGTQNGFASVMQQIKADDYRGRRIRLSAKLRGDTVKNWAGIWLRIDGDQKMLAFDNMHDRAPHGTFDWTPVSIVLDVAPEAKEIAFGFLENGDGIAYMGGLDLQVVGPEVATTDRRVSQTLPTRPGNLSLGN
jgi:hypothetical protein